MPVFASTRDELHSVLDPLALWRYALISSAGTIRRVTMLGLEAALADVGDGENGGGACRA